MKKPLQDATKGLHVVLSEMKKESKDNDSARNNIGVESVWI